MDNQNENLMQKYFTPNRIQKYLSEHEIFGKILQRVKHIPFAKIKKEEYFLAGREDEIYDEKKDTYRTPHVSEEERYYYISQRIVAAARECGSDITIMNGNIYFFNSIHWEKFQILMLRNLWF